MACILRSNTNIDHLILANYYIRVYSVFEVDNVWIMIRSEYMVHWILHTSIQTSKQKLALANESTMFPQHYQCFQCFVFFSLQIHNNPTILDLHFDSFWFWLSITKTFNTIFFFPLMLFVFRMTKRIEKKEAYCHGSMWINWDELFVIIWDLVAKPINCILCKSLVHIFAKHVRSTIIDGATGVVILPNSNGLIRTHIPI